MHTFYIYLYMVFIYTRLLFYMHYIADYIIFGHNKKKLCCFLSLESSFCLDVCLRVDTLSDYIERSQLLSSHGQCALYNSQINHVNWDYDRSIESNNTGTLSKYLNLRFLAWMTWYKLFETYRYGIGVNSRMCLNNLGGHKTNPH